MGNGRTKDVPVPYLLFSVSVCVCVCVKTVILHVYQEKVVKAESSGTCFNSIY